MKNEQLKKILDKLAKKNGGVLDPAHVVEFARPESSPIHSRFEWDNSKAAEEYRIYQARNLIRAVVVTIPNGEEGVTIRAYVSPECERNDGKPYISMQAAMADDAIRASLLQQFKRDARSMHDKYNQLREAQSVFEAMKNNGII